MKDGSDGSRAGASVSGQVARLTPPWREEIEVKVLKLGDLGVRWAVRAKHTPYAVRRKLAGGIPSHRPRAAWSPRDPEGGAKPPFDQRRIECADVRFANLRRTVNFLQHLHTNAYRQRMASIVRTEQR